MNRLATKPLFSLAIISSLLFAASAQARIVCWTNNEGIRECGNAVPPEYAQKETRTMNERGMTTEVKERAKTRAELAAEKAAKEEAERQAAIEEQRIREKQNYDRVLLSTYLNESELERSRKRQLGSFDATIEITRIAIDQLKEKLDDESKAAAAQERKGKPVSEKLQQSINSLQEQIEAKKAFIQQKEQGKMELNKKYDADLARFRELKKDGAKLR